MLLTQYQGWYGRVPTVPSLFCGSCVEGNPGSSRHDVGSKRISVLHCFNSFNMKSRSRDFWCVEFNRGARGVCDQASRSALVLTALGCGCVRLPWVIPYPCFHTEVLKIRLVSPTATGRRRSAVSRSTAHTVASASKKMVTLYGVLTIICQDTRKRGKKRWVCCVRVCVREWQEEDAFVSDN